MGEREDMTCRLSRLVEKRLNRNAAVWAAEVEYDGGRVDYVGYSPAVMNTEYGSASVVERGRFTFYEVKSCMADYESGHGLNFGGDDNFIVCPRELGVRLREELRLPHDVGVLVPDKGFTRLLPLVCYPKDDVWNRRSKATVELLWAVVYRSYQSHAGADALEGFRELERENQELRRRLEDDQG